ncbi:MAG: Csp protein [uncultured bacterium (gcode 4)]|uniref:Csp protein n=1 Tax=uncultured bacterium (gcode 4) TaxID=1234023 RepID=K2FYP6_9BACT|nr:MAG: Csp protein [uncultured bacterium (gcode 4)]
MNRQKKVKVLVLSFAMILNLISPFGDFIKWQKKYTYDQEIKAIEWNVEPIYSQVTSAYNLPKKITWYKKTWIIKFKWAKDMMVFSFDKKTVWNDEISISVNQDWVKKSVSIDEDWDERILKEDKIYSTPIFTASTHALEYEIQSQNKWALTADSTVTWINTRDYSEKISFWIENATADNNEIISRADWWADETLRYKDYPKWVAIYKQAELNDSKPKTEYQIKQDKRISDIRSYLSLNFPLEDNAVSTIRNDNGHALVWPIEKTKRVEKIFIHHTAEAMEWSQRDDAEIMRWIYAYHTITRWWWDIWYNYIIWRDGKIYEWRAWWDYSVAAHNLWNNKSTVWISVMGNFETWPIYNAQKNWVDKAIWIMSKKYWIDLNNKSIAHKECATSENCLVKDYQTYNLVWHKDAWSTSCPWKNLYVLLNEYRDYGKMYSLWLNYIENNKVESDSTNLKKWPMIKIRLSYTWETVDINSYTPEKVKISLWSKSWFTNLKNFHFEKRWNDQLALVVGNKSARVPYLTLSSTVLEVNSWNRKPTWDKTWKVNDNKFRWSITIRNENWNIVIINELPLEDYLKWLAEISNDENQEKAKTILVAARSYALWYTSLENRKFPWKPYDGSDNPDEFQKYLGYSFETRSNNIWRLVEDTNWMVIKYSWKLIKPWYFNQSNGKTKSYLEYCEERKKNWSFPASMACVGIPYLESAYDPAWIIDWWYKWHWVWISWAWAKYLADSEWMKYENIIKYFLKWVTVEKTSY